ncbi:MAG: biotin/lipoyl-binding protein, partial [Holophagales bacterium]|nr:biotin/lipoyl-binding protein [Holophagales bacterium]
MRKQFFNKRTIFLGFSGIVFLALIIIAGLFIFSKSDSTLYTWDVITRGDIQETISASGQFKTKIMVNIGTSVMGEIKEIQDADGQNVKAGDLLVIIDSERVQQ